MNQNHIELSRNQIVKVYNEDGSFKRYARLQDLTPVYDEMPKNPEDSFLLKESNNTFCEWYRTIKGELKKSNVMFTYNQNK